LIFLFRPDRGAAPATRGSREVALPPRHHHSLADCASGFGWVAVGNLGCDLPDDEFFK
jgi:hypothetical protein